MRHGLVMVPISEEMSRELGVYGIVWDVAKAEAESLGGRLTGEHWIQREQLHDSVTGEFIGVLVQYVWKMVER